MSDEQQKASEAPVTLEDSEAEGVVGGAGGDADTNPDGSFPSRLPEGGEITKGPGAGE